ncbi:MAG: tetratricopeptide repeat protein [Chlorobi bacterium]|nr:tetratricopeptide repeat protein [Chlorobiota bacterium]
MPKRYTLTYFLLFFSVYIFSQNIQIDSLINASEYEKSDSIRIKNYLEISRLYNSSDQNDSALYFLRKGKICSEQLMNSKKQSQKETGSFLLAECYYSVALIEYNDLNFSSAEKDYNEAMQICNHLIKYSESQMIKTEVLKLKANIHSGIANIYIDKGYYSVALNNFLNAQKITDTLINNGIIPEKESAAQFFHLGLIHYYLNNFQKSIKYYKKALEISEKYHNESAIAKINSNIGIVETQLNHIETALSYLKKALKYAEKEKNEILKAQIFDNMADCYSKQKNYHNAELYLAKAMIITEKYNSKQGKIYILLGLADVYNKTNKYRRAKDYSDRALILAESIKSISFIRDIYLQISEIYENEHHYEDALNYFKKYKTLEDSIINKEKLQQIQESESKYLSAKKQEEINRQKLELAKRDSELKIKKTQNYIFGAVVLFLIVLIFIIFITLKQKQKINNLIQKQNKKITDSIEYAKKIQTAALPSEKVLNRLFKSHFVLFKPLQIVSGDFYWAVKKDNFIVFAAADCTGHGIPGAFISMQGISFLNELTLISDLTRPDLILEEMRFILKKSFRQTGKFNEQSDGIDISLCSINTDTDELYFAGANNSAYLIRNNEIIELEAVSNPIGIYYKEIAFKKQKFKLQKDDIIYLFTDGYADQFGINENKIQKFTIKRFRELLIEINQKPPAEQKEILEKTYFDRKKQSKQIDDILIFGIRY